MSEIIKRDDKQEIALVKALTEQWMDDAFIASALKTIATTAITQNNKWDQIEDYNTRLKAIQTILKIKDKSFDRWWVNLNFFQAPDVNNLKY